MSERPLYDYQLDSIARLNDIRARNRESGESTRVIIKGPTGCGKTVIATEITRLERLSNPKAKISIVMPAVSLIDQTVVSFAKHGIPKEDIGVIQQDHYLTNHKAHIQICSIQTLEQFKRLPYADLVLIDEVHQFRESYVKWMEDPEWRRRDFIGLSATPWRKGLGKHFSDMIVVATIQGLIKSRHLVPYRAFAPFHPDLSQIEILADDYNLGQLSETMRAPKLVANAVETWLARAGGRKTLTYGVDIPTPWPCSRSLSGTASPVASCTPIRPSTSAPPCARPCRGAS